MNNFFILLGCVFFVIGFVLYRSMKDTSHLVNIVPPSSALNNTRINHGEPAGRILKVQHIYCFEALKSSPNFDFVCSLSNKEQLTSDKSQIAERQLMSELWDTGYCTMCDKVHVTDVVDVGLLQIYKAIFDNWQANDKPTFEHWVARDIGVRVRKTSTDFERLAENLDKHLLHSQVLVCV